MATPNSKLTYDALVKLLAEVQTYDDYAPNALSADQEIFKKIDDKLIPFALQEELKRTVLIKDVNGKNRERFLDTLLLNYSRLQNGVGGLDKAKETFIGQLNDIRTSFAEIVQAIPSNDSATAPRIELAMKNIEVLIPLVKNLNEAASKAALDAKLLEKPAVVDASKPTLLGNALVAATDSAVQSGAVTNTGLIASAIALLFPTSNTSGGTIVTVESPSTGIGTSASTNTPSSGGFVDATANTSLQGATTNITTGAGTSVGTGTTGGSGATSGVPSVGTTGGTADAASSGNRPVRSPPQIVPPKVVAPPILVQSPQPGDKPIAQSESWWTTGRTIAIALAFLFLIIVFVIFVLSVNSKPKPAAFNTGTTTLQPQMTTVLQK